jgi:hypothetical protein
MEDAMSWKLWGKKPSQENSTPQAAGKLSGPKELPSPVGRTLVVTLGKEPDWVWRLKCVMRPRPEDGALRDVRVFDAVEATSQGFSVKDYTSLDLRPEIILFEGWFNKKTQEARLEEKRSPLPRAA